MAETPHMQSTSTRLAALRESSKRHVAMDIDGQNIRRTAGNIAAMTKEMALGSKKATKADFNMHTGLLDAQKLTSNLSALAFSSDFEAAHVLDETDIESYLKNEYETTMLMAIEEAKSEADNEFNMICTMAMHDEWDETRRELAEYLSDSKNVWKSKLRVPYNDQSTFTTPSRPDVNRNTTLADRKMIEYARVVYLINEARRNGKAFGVTTKFLDKCISFNEKDVTTHASLIDCWKLLLYIVNEKDVDSATGMFEGSDVVAQNEYSGIYYSTENVTERDIRYDFVRRSILFLQSQYAEYIERIVRSDPNLNRSNEESVMVGLVKAFIQKINPNNGHIPFWQVLYYLIRCGKFTDAIAYANENGEHDFAHYIDIYAHDETGSADELEQVALKHKGKYVQNDIGSVYCELVYNIIGRCDPKRSYTSVVPNWTAQDYMWFKLSMITQERASVTSTGLGTLGGFRNTIKRYGPSHFDAQVSNPFVYFQVLLLSQHFGLALQFLNSTAFYPIETLHFSVAMYYYGLIKITDDDKVPIFGEGEGDFTEINYSKLVDQYTRIFATTDPYPALQYIYTIRNDTKRNKLIRNLILLTGDFTSLVGTIKPDGTRHKGHIFNFLSEDECSEIIQSAAIESEKTGNYDHALRLYDVVGKYEEVFAIVNKHISRLLTVQSDERKNVVDFIKFIYRKYEREGNEHLCRELRTVMSLVDFFNLVHNSQYSRALDLIHHLEILPFSVEKIEQRKSGFDYLKPYIKNNFGDMLIATMKCLVEVAKLASKEKLAELRKIAYAIVTFSGNIRNYKLPTTVYSTLVKLETTINSNQ